MPEFDPNLTPARPDLAAAHLRGVVAAERYVEGVLYQISAGIAAIRATAAADAEQLSQAQFGDTFCVYEERDGFGWGQSGLDAYVGWVDMEALSAPVVAPTHRVVALRTYVFSAPNLKSAPLFLLSLNARVTVEAEDGRWRKIARAGWVAAEHIAPYDSEFAPDPVAVAERFVGAPYQWGGVESLGLDCSGLVLAGMRAAGLSCPRDSYMQAAALGRPIDPRGPLQRGDLVFWKGHVGIMVDAERLLHANAHHMAVTIEPLSIVAARNPNPITTIKRLI
jgi:cell wall-associated NlpC family hydrolase